MKGATRRSIVLGGLAAVASSSLPGTAHAGADDEERELDIIDLELEGDPRLARKARLVVPRRAGSKRLPGLILLHGLGETRSPALGLRAWSELYGLERAYRRLRHPPLERPESGARYFTDEHRQALNESLRKDPFRGVVCVCPVTPNPHAGGSAAGVLDRYADWIVDTLLPAVERRGVATDRWGLDGCSLGGYVALEVFIRKPERFATLGGVQAAIGASRVAGYASRLGQAMKQASRPVPVHLETSTQDPYRKANESLADALRTSGLDAKAVVLPGPHNQLWLKDVGTLEMLRWHERRLG